MATGQPAKQKPKATWHDLPQELHDDILDRVLLSTTITIERGELRDASDEFVLATNSEMSRLPGLPKEVASLKLVCRKFAADIGKEWHSKVTYHFPTTISFVDVLSQWPAQRVQSLRYASVCDTTFLARYCGYMGQCLSSALPLLAGLQLDTLTVHNMQLDPSGEQVKNHAYLGAYLDILNYYPPSQGWKHLEYVSGILPLLPSHLARIEEMVEDYKTKKHEMDFEVEIVGRLRPQDCDLLLYEDRSLRDVRAAEMAKWYADHPEEGKPEDFPEETAKKVTVRMRRGEKAGYAQKGDKQTVVGGWLEQMSWEEMRKTDDYIIDDGLHVRPY